MNLKHRAVPLHVKEITQKGEFCGYASVFDVLDYYRDVIREGAFTQTLAKWAAKSKLPPLLWQHDSGNPIGPHTLMREEKKGLYVEAKLLIDDVPQARIAHSLLTNKVIDGMSIGFDYAEEGMQYDGKTNVWNILAVDLWENSLATFPANVEATVTDVKSRLAAGKMPTLSEFEDLLRDVAGFSRKHAKVIVANGYRSLLRDAGGDPLRDAEDGEKSVDPSLLNPLLSYLETRNSK